MYKANLSKAGTTVSLEYRRCFSRWRSMSHTDVVCAGGVENPTCVVIFKPASCCEQRKNKFNVSFTVADSLEKINTANKNCSNTLHPLYPCVQMFQYHHSAFITVYRNYTFSLRLKKANNHKIQGF